MSGKWVCDCLDDLVDIRVSNVDKKMHEGETLVRLCNYMDVYANDYITGDLPFMAASASASQIARFSVLLDDVLLTKDSETPDDIAIPAVVAEQIDNLVSGYHLALLRPDAQKICGSFLAKQLCRYETNRHFANRANGSTRYGLTLDVLEKAPICHPVSIDEQRHIASILLTCDTVLTQTKAAIEKYESIKHGMLNDLLTRGLASDGTLRPHHTQAPDLYQPSPLGVIPKGWEVKQLGECCELYAGGTPNRSIDEYFGGDIPWVKSGEVCNNSIVSTEETITVRGFESSSTKWIPAETTLIAMYGATAGQVGWLRIKATCNQAVLSVSPYIANISSRYLYYFLHQIMPGVARLATGSGQPNLSKDIIERTLIAYSKDISEQKAIAARLSATDDKITAEQKALKKYQSLKEGLMRRLLTPPEGVEVL
jgi:type I restriction enzyme S subunit